MKKFIIVVTLLAALGYGASRYFSISRANDGLERRVESRLDEITPSSIPAVQKAVIEDAGKLGITLTPENITVSCAPTDTKTYSQKLVGKKINVAFMNTNVAINVEYTANFFGLGLKQKIEKSIIHTHTGPTVPTAEATKAMEDTP